MAELATGEPVCQKDGVRRVPEMNSTKRYSNWAIPSAEDTKAGGLKSSRFPWIRVRTQDQPSTSVKLSQKRKKKRAGLARSWQNGSEGYKRLLPEPESHP